MWEKLWTHCYWPTAFLCLAPQELEQQVSTTTSMLKAAQTLVKIREGDLERVQRRSDELEEVSAVQARRLRDACIDLAGLRELGSFERLRSPPPPPPPPPPPLPCASVSASVWQHACTDLVATCSGRELVGQNRSMAVVASDKRSHSLARLRHSLERMERMDAKNESVNDDCMTILREREEAMAAMKSWKQRCIRCCPAGPPGPQSFASQDGGAGSAEEGGS